MTKQNKILIITLSLIIGLLSLIGFSYAYYLINVKGNTTNKSIVLTSADLELIYDDGTNEIITISKFRPDTVIATKTFTVENTGSKGNHYAIYLEDVVNEYIRQEDMNISLTCKTIDTTNDEYIEEVCNDVDGAYPSNNAMILNNDIGTNRKHEYTLIIKYLEAGVDQSVDMAKKIEGKVQIYSLNDTVDIKGTVAGSSDDYCVETENQSTLETKISYIEANGNYLIPALEAGNYKISIKDCNTSELKGSTDFSLKRGKENKVENGNEITVTSDAQTIPFNITNIDTTLEIEVSNAITQTELVDAEYIALNAATYYGKTVNYTPNNSNLTDIEWQIFHSDGENIYLIAKNYIDPLDAPTKNGKNLVVADEDNTYNLPNVVDLSNVSDEYNTPELIQEAIMEEWMEPQFLDYDYLKVNMTPSLNGNTSKTISMQSIAYLHDQTIWNTYLDINNKAEYVLGGAPLELFLDSYNKTHPDINLGYGFESVELWGRDDNWGYQLTMNGGELKYKIENLSPRIELEGNKIPLYLMDLNATYADGYWLSSPFGSSMTLTGNINSTAIFTDTGDPGNMNISSKSSVKWLEIDEYNFSLGQQKAFYGSGLRPIVCLNSNVLLSPSTSYLYDYIIK